LRKCSINLKNNQMRGLNLCFIILIFSLSSYSQSERWKQKNARINFAFTPQFEFVRIGGNYNPTVSLSGNISFNNTFFVGSYITKKMIKNPTNYAAAPTLDLDPSFQHFGFEFLYAMRLGLYRTKGGHYVHPKIKVVFGTRLGVGLVWLNNGSDRFYTESDYFGYIQPMVGVAYPLNDFITVHGGINGTAALKIQKLDAYFENKDFLGPGAYLAFKFTLFR
jgi:hypothetical protein